MSARQKARLRRLEEEKRRQEKVNLKEEEEEEEEEEEDYDRPKGFAFLTSSEEESSSEEEESEQEQERDRKADAEKEGAAETEDVKRERKKKEQEDKNRAELEALEDAISQAKAEQAKQKEGEVEHVDSFVDLLKVKNTKSLNPDNELKRKLGRFGAEVGATVRDTAAAVSSRGSKVQGRAKKRPHQSLFCTLNEDERLPAPTFSSGGAKMIVVGETEDGGTMFTFEPSDLYKQSQKIFEHIQATHDPNQIVSFLNKYPMHLPAHLAMCEFYLQTAQLESAESMLRAALFILECYLHPRFAKLVAEGKARFRLQSTEQDDCGVNQVFLRTLFKSMMICRRRSLTDTAFSLGLLLFSFDYQQDPYHLALILDQLALQNGLFDFVVKAYQLNPTFRALPSMAFSYALALHRKGDEVKAIQAAEDALIKFPGAFVALMNALEKADVSVSDPMIQSGLEKCKALEKTKGADIACERLFDFFARTSHLMWKNVPVGSGAIPPYQWLAFRASNLEPRASSSATTTEEQEKEQAVRTRYAAVRFSQFVDDTGAVNLVDDGEQVQQIAEQSQMAPNVDLDTHWLALFFQTMMPWARLPPRQPNNENQ